jgi:N-acylneuraminate cytidylyltransferase
MKAIAIIPARGGSKRIPRKNIKPFLGKPILAYSIEAALKSGCFEEVMVSTEDEEIAAIAKQYGAKVPFLRSAETANDYAVTADVINEVLAKYEENGQIFDAVACIYSTAPFVTVERLQEAMAFIQQGDFDSAFTCVEYSFPVLRSMVVDEKGRIAMKWPQYRNTRSQDLPPFYHDAGQFYVATMASYKKAKNFWGENTAPIILSELEVQDLDTMTDWALAEMKYKLLREKNA